MPDGLSIPVKVKEDSGQLWFGTGWSKLCKRYGVYIANLIVLQYKGNAEFDVFLFDLTTIEINYEAANTMNHQQRGKDLMDQSRMEMGSTYQARFFEILITQQQLSKVQLPSIFVKKYKYEVLGTCMLRTPDGTKIAVKVITKNRRLYFAEGWATLCDRYGVCMGYLIVFQYSGDAHFDLIVFDMAAAEIEYNVARPLERRQNAGRSRMSGGASRFLTACPCFSIVITDASLKKHGQL